MFAPGILTAYHLPPEKLVAGPLTTLPRLSVSTSLASSWPVSMYTCALSSCCTEFHDTGVLKLLEAPPAAVSVMLLTSIFREPVPRNLCAVECERDAVLARAAHPCVVASSHSYFVS